jgi:hypothetical protein
MPERVVLPIHGPDHCPGGPDPIPCLTSSLPVFRAVIQGTEDSEANRTHYPSGDGGDNVYFDAWDPTYDTSIFDISDYDFTDPNTGRPSIAGVGLKLPGLYSIMSQVDIYGYLNGFVDMRSGWDEGQSNYWEVANIPQDNDFFLQDQMVYRVDHWRHVEHGGGIDDDNAVIMPVAWDVEIVFAQNNATGLSPFGGVDPGAASVFPYTPVPDSDVWIPGGTWNAGWGLIPFLLIAYWGEPTSGFDPDWTSTLELDGTD